ncbi:ABC transporter permease [Hoeflea prorocentri]|uniref:ABC transporter permease n=1 Tax=Hoeflea prorocentri TaxID=1922333 RepID=A0A9X3ULG6_9HYPH|nr:ABC transporter permease [Hoeflea prorocentri]MCY6382595.1 ABC transporter permease [Hoeflea prorocentri]MDA5400395.1 ABC transporter permease [Hoeflea prorocentri]
MVFVLWAVATILFLMFRLMPSNPLAAYIDPTFTEEQQQALMAKFGLDRPLWEQYFIYLKNLLQGELGDSFFYRQPVGERVLELLPNTLILTFSSLIIAYAFGIVVGAWLAWKRDTIAERAAIPVVLTTRAMPEFWLGMLLLAVFSFTLGWFPAGGTRSPGSEYDGYLALYTSADFLSHLVLPALTLAIYSQGLPLLLMRSNMLEVMNEDFVTMARIKGLSNWTVVVRHAARNALLPVMTSFAIAVGYQIQGNVVVETVFSWPGLGRELVNAVSASDYPLAQGAFLMIAIVVVLMNLLADLLYSLLDPRVSHA